MLKNFPASPISIYKSMQDSSTLKPIIIASGLIIVFVLYGYFSGKIHDFLLGEEYYIFGNAAVYPHFEAWWKYFLANGRLLEGIYWTYLYEIIDFSPAKFRLFSYGLVLLSSLLATVSICRIWPVKKDLRTIAFLLPLLFFFIPHGMNWATRLSGDNSRLAVLFFWISVLFVQQWAASGFRIVFLFFALLFHLLALFTYENTVFLFPAAILLSIPFFPQGRRNDSGFIAKKLGLYGFISLLLAFIPYTTYFFIREILQTNISHHIFEGGRSLDRLLNRFLPNLLYYLQNISKLTSTHFDIFSTWFFYILIIGSWLALFFKALKRGKSSDSDRRNQKETTTFIVIAIAAIWIFFLSLAIWSIYNPLAEDPTRAYISAMFAFPILLVILYSISKWPIWRILVASAMMLWIAFGIIEFHDKSELLAPAESQYNFYLLSLLDTVPDVRPNTSFVFIDFGLLNTGCGPSLSMLYQKENLSCATIFRGPVDYRAGIRYPGNVLDVPFAGGWIRNGNIILVAINKENEMTIVSEILPGDDFDIVWNSHEPIRTDYARIITDSSHHVSPMAANLKARREMINFK